MGKTVIIVEDESDVEDNSLSHKFTREVQHLGYTTEEIDSSLCPEDYFGEDGEHYWYIESSLSDSADVSIIVNVDAETRRKVEEDFEAFTIKISKLRCVESYTHDWTIFDDDTFKERTKKLLRVLTKDIKHIKEIV